MKLRIWLLLLISLPVIVLAQTDTDEQLAAQYFKNGEYDKAEVYYQKLYKRYNDEFFYRYYIDCLLKLEEFKKAERDIEKRIRKEEDPTLYVQLGQVYKTSGEDRKAQQTYAKAVQEMPPMQREIERLAEAFAANNEWQQVVQVYEKGRRVLNGLYRYRFELAEAHLKLGDLDRALDEYLSALTDNGAQVGKVRAELLTIFEDDASGSKREYFEETLIGRIQRAPQQTAFSELLIWYFEQEKKFAQAFAQAKALDRRNNEDGARIMQLAHVSRANGAFDVAIDGYRYVKRKGQDSYYYFSASKELVATLYLKAVERGNMSEKEMQDLEQTFLQTLDEFGKNANVAEIMMNLAELYTFHMHRTNTGIDMLYEVLELPGLDKTDEAEAKIQLADALLFVGEIWESTLLYSQAEKMFKRSDIGRTAKLKNAKLAYYTGQFEWARAQLNVLKAATSDLIANDALYLAMLIADNSYMDTTYEALGIFARADLLLFQNKTDSALMALDSISKFHKGHSLEDDIIFKRGEIAEQRGRLDSAIAHYHEVWKRFPEDLLADDAVYRMAQLYENGKKDSSKAMEYYQVILLDHPGSLFTVEARKRYRTLRGDLLN